MPEPLARINDLVDGQHGDFGTFRGVVTQINQGELADRIAEAYLQIPAGNPPADDVATSSRAVMDAVGAEVQRLHPSYRGAPA